MSAADRRAALELHPLGRTDRQWVLGQLAAGERARIEPLLAELDAMNIRFEPSAPDSTLASLAGFAAGGAAGAPTGEPAARIAAAGPAEMLRVLAGEPAWLVSAALASGNWPWVEPVRRALIADGSWSAHALAGDRPRPGLVAALLPLLAVRLTELAARSRSDDPPEQTRPSETTAGPMSGLWPRVRQWLK
ncbi:MAG: hypothetical protein NTV19_13000 [Burkholderiales bacterium]|nr:hypothetical protein [Burkholderiales bacterium]